MLLFLRKLQFHDLLGKLPQFLGRRVVGRLWRGSHLDTVGVVLATLRRQRWGYCTLYRRLCRNVDTFAQNCNKICLKIKTHDIIESKLVSYLVPIHQFIIFLPERHPYSSSSGGVPESRINISTPGACSAKYP